MGRYYIKNIVAAARKISHRKYSVSYMKKIFKRATGVTMREWRRQNAAGQA